jgi:hypothetical protein
VDRSTFDRSVIATLAPTLVAAGIPPTTVGCTSAPHGHDLDVHLRMPHLVDDGLRRALTVRVLDAVAASGDRYGDVDVHFDHL